MAIKIGGTTIVTDSRGVSNITSGVIVGIESAGTRNGIGATTLNFVGSGVSIRGVDSATIDVVIAGGSGGGGGSLGISSNALNTDPAKNTLVGTGITHLNFVGAAVTNVGLTTSVVTISKTLTLGRRSPSAAAEISLLAAGLAITLRGGSTVTV